MATFSAAGWTSALPASLTPKGSKANEIAPVEVDGDRARRVYACLFVHRGEFEVEARNGSRSLLRSRTPSLSQTPELEGRNGDRVVLLMFAMGRQTLRSLSPSAGLIGNGMQNSVQFH